MSGRMTPERRAEIDAILTVSCREETCDTRFEWRLVTALRDTVAEIDALTAELAAKDKALDQAIPIVQAYWVLYAKQNSIGFRVMACIGCPLLAQENRRTPQTGGAMSDRPECAECPHSYAFDGLSDDLCCEIDPTTPRCESCGVPFVKHLGLIGTCAEKERYLRLLRRVLMGKGAVSADDWERMGYPDVAEFLREEEKRT